jgi:hypothetical protein
VVNRRPAPRGFAQFQILSEEVYAILRTAGVINGDLEPRRLLDEFRKLKIAQLAYARELCMTPAAYAALKLNSDNSAFDLAAVAALDISEQRYGSQDAACATDAERAQDAADVPVGPTADISEQEDG